MPVNRGGFILCARRGEVEALSFASLIPKPSHSHPQPPRTPQRTWFYLPSRETQLEVAPNTGLGNEVTFPLPCGELQELSVPQSIRD